MANAFSTLGLILMAYGLVVLSVLPVVAGIVIVHLACGSTERPGGRLEPFVR